MPLARRRGVCLTKITLEITPARDYRAKPIESGMSIRPSSDWAMFTVRFRFSGSARAQVRHRWQKSRCVTDGRVAQLRDVR